MSVHRFLTRAATALSYIMIHTICSLNQHEGVRTAHHAKSATSCEPGIYFDEVHRHPVCSTCGQQKRLLDGGSVGFDIVAATDISELAASCDFAAIPSLEVARVVEVRGNR